MLSYYHSLINHVSFPNEKHHSYTSSKECSSVYDLNHSFFHLTQQIFIEYDLCDRHCLYLSKIKII